MLRVSSDDTGDQQKNVTCYDVTGDGLRARSLLRNDKQSSGSAPALGGCSQHKTWPAFYQILLDLDTDLVRSPLGAFDALLQGWRGVPHPLLQQVLMHNIVNVGRKILNQVSLLARVPAARPPPAPAFS